MNVPLIIAIVLCLSMVVTVIILYATLFQKDSAENTKIQITISAFSFVASLVAYGLALTFFKSNPNYMLHFILAITMLLMLPASLISIAVSTLAVSNLLDTLAAS